MNLLVSILSDINSKVMSMYKSERLRAKCRLINENEVLFNRADLFRDTKYVVRAEIERVESEDQGDNAENAEVAGSKTDDIIGKVKQLVVLSEERSFSQFKMIKAQI